LEMAAVRWRKLDSRWKVANNLTTIYRTDKDEEVASKGSEVVEEKEGTGTLEMGNQDSVCKEGGPHFAVSLRRRRTTSWERY
jgi:23S rRNA G2069 N7-methylase RlmK/C1962 C5-methylase RlmI